MKNFSVNKIVLPVVALIFAPVISHAHTGVGSTSGFGAGFGHPLGGADHVLAMVAVGIWAFQSGGKGVWLIPVSFLGMMIVGGLLGFSGVAIPYVETGIFISILAFGALIAAAARVPLAAGMIITGLFAVFHGHSHGTEIPAVASGIYYSLGFVLATAGLHAAGIAGASVLARRLPSVQLVRYSGVAIAAAGVLFCL